MSSVLRRAPLAAALAVWTAGVAVASTADPDVHDRLVARFGLSWDDVVRGRVDRLVGNLLVPHAGGDPSVALPVVAVALAESVLGTRRTLVVGVLGDWLGTLPLLVVLRRSRSASVRAFTEEHDVGLSAVAAAALAAAAVRVRGKRRLAALAVVDGALLTAAVTNREVADLQHLAAGLAGTALELLLPRVSP